jgi:diguanylate cyclase (GGDEF)-like protein
MDVPGRLGGEEFVVVLPRTDLAAAAAFAERLRSVIARLDIALDATNVTVTASFGVGQFQPGEEFEDLLARCDEALYRAKREGRDRIVMALDQDSLAA